MHTSQPSGMISSKSMNSSGASAALSDAAMQHAVSRIAILDNTLRRMRTVIPQRQLTEAIQPNYLGNAMLYYGECPMTCEPMEGSSYARQNRIQNRAECQKMTAPH